METQIFKISTKSDSHLRKCFRNNVYIFYFTSSLQYFVKETSVHATLLQYIFVVGSFWLFDVITSDFPESNFPVTSQLTGNAYLVSENP